MIFEGSMRVGFCTTCCKRWFFAFDGIECQDASIEARLQGSKAFSGMGYRHVRLDGYCARPRWPSFSGIVGRELFRASQSFKGPFCAC